MGTILIRVDASHQIGMGHLIRCLSIANHVLDKGIKPVFITSSSLAREKINTKGFECVLISDNFQYALKEMKSLKTHHSSKIILVDINYCKTIEERQRYYDILQGLMTMDYFLVTFEDFFSEVFPADIVIIPYVGAESLKFKRKRGSQYLLGPKFFPIRNEFLEIGKKSLHKDDVKNILVTMGGSDPNQITIKVIKALSNLKFKVHLIVVLGSLSKITDERINALLSNYGGSFQVIKNAHDMAQLMNKSQLTITNSGLTKYEMANMGLPTIIITNSKEYVALMDNFADYGTAVHIGYCKDVTKENILNGVYKLINDRKKRKIMSDLGKQLVDGYGIERIFNCIPGEIINA